MARIIFFDSDPAGLVCHDPGNLDRAGLWYWMVNELTVGSLVLIPAVVDYEVRRELIRVEAWVSIQRLDALYINKYIRHLSISDDAMRTAARLWAVARQRGDQTAHDQALDGDVILSAQAMEFCSDTDDWQIITNNVSHIARYVGNHAVSRPKVIGEWMKSERSNLRSGQE